MTGWLGRALLGSAAIALVAGVFVVAADRGARAADHLDPPARTDPAVDTTPDKAADIADVYAWHTPTDLVIAVTFAGPQASNLPATYDRDMLYTINISNDDVTFTPEVQIHFRFGQNGSATGVQFTGVPGTTGAIEGPVEADLRQGQSVVRAGLFDDPFFFDLEGFRATRATGALSFRSNRNFFAGQNLTAGVVQFPRSAIDTGSGKIRIWATSARFGGNI
ncbi:hypothetical protein [Rhizorhabdus dicambivorans]|uniref:DUF4331 domain-containing protein n=1 Tax=Rhizorhabdus dicambivorans TaxID=1850238 RepID=A0A2A4FSQ8_9SPHN|nr:hypothetical protein [Rhizorhabdus dicambivorans]ATE63492.1 hypothetical protein CMV14_02960 [Rhizorhabdus dicambivorans]PCE41453.1 hypothetical protein COO09_15425 [Rhizorhabdus dicambivorans]